LRALLLLFCFLSTALFAQAQNRLVQINGKVKADSDDIESVTVQNLRSGAATITDSNGRFQIQVQLGDTLVLSAVQFKTKQFVYDQSFRGVTSIEIPMDSFVNKLKGVTLQPFGLSGRINTDLDSLAIEGPPTATSLGLPNANIYIPTKNERMLYEATSGGGLIPLNPLLNALTGRTKELKNQVRLERKNQTLELVIKRYEQLLFEDQLGIKKDDVRRFLYFCESDSLFVSTLEKEDEILFYEFLKSKALQFNSL
jgi:hypothetical protein